MHIFFIVQIHRLHELKNSLWTQVRDPGSRCSWCGPAALASPGCCWNTGSQPHPRPTYPNPQFNKNLWAICVHTEIRRAMQNRCLVRSKQQRAVFLNRTEKSGCRFVFILLSAFYNLLPAMEDIWTIWWRWDHGCHWRLSVLPWGQPSGQGQGCSHPLQVTGGPGRFCSLGRGSWHLSTTISGAVDPGQYASRKGYLDLRPKSSFPIQVFQHETETVLCLPALFV